MDWDRDGSTWPHRDASRFVDAGGLRWHVQSFGQGPVLLLLHGTGSSAHSWRDLAPRLAARNRVVAPDLPGHAFSTPLPAARRSLPGMARALADLLRVMELQPRAVVGHSAGAALMLRWALDQPQAARRLIGVNAALLPFEGWAGALLPPLARLLALNPLLPRLASWRARDPAAVRRLIAATGSTLDEAGLALYQRLICSPTHVAGVLSMTANWDLHRLVQDLSCWAGGLHLIVGGRDATVPPEQAARVADRVAGTQVHHLPALGHLAHEEDPLTVADRVLALTA